MKKKLMLIIGIIILTSGCDAEYTLELNSNQFKEKMEINNYNKSTWDNTTPSYRSSIDIAAKSSFATDYRNERPETNDKQEGVNYYNIEKINTSNNLGLKFETIFDIENYKYSTIVFNTTEDIKYSYNKKNINIKVEKEKKVFTNYPNLNNLTIKFITNHEVLNNNADEIKGGVYYWYLNKNDYNKEIELEISTKYEEKKLDVLEVDEDGYFGPKTLVVVYVIIGAIFNVAVGVIFIKVWKSNI